VHREATMAEGVVIEVGEGEVVGGGGEEGEGREDQTENWVTKWRGWHCD